MGATKKDFSLNCKGTLISLAKPIVMGILNITPDSFFDGGKNKELSQAVQQCQKMLKDGAIIIDIGSQSSRPNAQLLSADEEIIRLKKILPTLNNEFNNVIFSIDTFYAKTAQYAVENGCSIINDISAGDEDKNMLEMVKKLDVPYIAMHKKGMPKNMQSNPDYNNVCEEVFEYLYSKKEKLLAMGINDFVFDPGFGFGKSIEHNYTLLQNLDIFTNLEAPILVGLSRKSMIYNLLKTDAQNALNGTTVLHTLALLKGAHILRVHDVKEAVECVKLVGQMNE